jgi:hypothetical protein
VTSRLPGVRPLSVPCPIQNRTSTQERATCAFDLASSIPRSFVLLLTPRFLLRLASRTHRVPTDFVSLGQYPSPCPLCVPPRMQSFSSPSPDTRARGAAGVKKGGHGRRCLERDGGRHSSNRQATASNRERGYPRSFIGFACSFFALRLSMPRPLPLGLLRGRWRTRNSSLGLLHHPAPRSLTANPFQSYREESTPSYSRAPCTKLLCL